MQRRRRVGAVPRGHPRLPGDVASAPGRRGRRRRADPRPQHAADRHARTGGRVAGVVQHPPRLCLARRAHARDRRICVRVDAPRRSAAALRPIAARRGRAASPRARARNRRGDSSCSRWHSCSLFSAAVAALSRERRRPRAGRLHRPRGRSDPRRRRRQRARRGQRALDAARRLPRHAGMHFDAADPGLSRGRLRLFDDMAAADPGRPRRAAALHRPGHRAASGRRAARAWWRRRCSWCTRSINCSSARSSCSSPRCGATAAARRSATRWSASSWACCSSICSARSTRAWSRIRPARRSTIRRERSRSCPRSRSASISRCGSRPSSRSAGGASSPASRCSGSRRRRACSRCRPSPATPA